MNMGGCGHVKNMYRGGIVGRREEECDRVGCWSAQLSALLMIFGNEGEIWRVSIQFFQRFFS